MIELTVLGRDRPLPGGLSVKRTLPVREVRHVGPFVFLDHMGPVTFEAGRGADIPPHPHIGLATVTYLIEGELHHRDSLGSSQVIVPGDVNWMSAGRGIVHSERTPTEARARGSSLHGIQMWVALPESEEESAPSFEHCEASRLPVLPVKGAELRVIAGRAFGVSSPVKVASPLFCVDVSLADDAMLELPDEYTARAAHIVSGKVECDGQSFSAGTLIVFKRDRTASIRATATARVLLVGGDELEGERHIEWNFVSSSKDRIERAKRDWREQRFARVPGETDFVPLP